MGILFAVMVVACSASSPPNSAAPPAPRVKEASTVTVARDARSNARVSEALARAERDFARRTRDLGLSGTSPLFGAEGLPRPRLR